ncbi:hypothetical protein FC72_GL001935 [Companilactobacillus tucceti DSM 20183]|uniref:S-layer protein C-terminal domain-containing protein n=1 Tax=Companilactobacillus tucceti DSM 20183 TaxID=1423811 RepID=A0A0R1J0A9_9LACO|nr:hypothetical protein FC72_GL001935 [Companilactobacillus tucceti DSM 20183]
MKDIFSKKIVVISLLSFASGLVLLGTTDVVHADATNQTAQVESTNTSLDIPEGIAKDHQGTLQGDNGSSWYLDNDGTLHIGAGDVDNPDYTTTPEIDSPQSDSVWANYKYADDITKVVFDEGAVAGRSLENYFNNLSNLKNVDVSKLDVSNTVFFNSMFSLTSNLESLDISNWNLAKADEFTDFVSYSGVKTVNFSNIKFNGRELLHVFLNDSNLTDINFSGASLNPSKSVSGMFNDDYSLRSLDLTSFVDLSKIPLVYLNGMLGGLNFLTSLKVKDNTILKNTYLPDVDSSKYTGWTDGTHLFNTDELEGVYDKNTSTDPDARTSTTWTLTDKPKVDYTINYYDNSTKKLLGTVSGSGVEDGKVYLKPDYPGYNTSVTDGSKYIDLTSTNTTHDFYLKPISSNNGSNSNSSGNTVSTTSKNQKVATTTKIVKLYNDEGKLITNRALGINTAWKSDVVYKSNGITYYRVSSDEYVKAKDVYVYTDKVAKIKVNDDKNGDLVDYLGGDLDRKLKSGSTWKTDRIALINGKEYYRVSTDEFVPVSEVTEY